MLQLAKGFNSSRYDVFSFKTSKACNGINLNFVRSIISSYPD